MSLRCILGMPCMYAGVGSVPYAEDRAGRSVASQSRPSRGERVQRWTARSCATRACRGAGRLRCVSPELIVVGGVLQAVGHAITALDLRWTRRRLRADLVPIPGYQAVDFTRMSDSARLLGSLLDERQRRAFAASHRPANHRLPLPARHEQMEQGRAPPVQLHLQRTGAAARWPPTR